MKASTGCFESEGREPFAGLLKPQWVSYTPPCWIHCSSRFFSASVSDFLDFGGGPIITNLDYLREIGQNLCKAGCSGTIVKVRWSEGRLTGTPIEEITDTPP